MYAYVIRRALNEWSALPEWYIPQGFQPATRISVVLPARNEAAHIGACLGSVLQQSYPSDLYEIIVVDDHSEDETPTIVQHWQSLYPSIRLLRLADFVHEPLNSYKKKAIEIAVAHATGELIVTTDADCIVPPDWLRLLASCYEHARPAGIAAPVGFFRERNSLERFQSLDNAGVMLLTGAGMRSGVIHLSNGANLAYPKQVFEELAGFAGIDRLASGDDMLLVHKIAAAYPGRMVFLKNAHAKVLTEAKPEWRSFLNQRIRWATKSAAYREWRLTLLLAVVFGLCCNIVLSGLLALLAGTRFLPVFMGQLAIKTFFDYRLLSTACRYFHRRDLMRSFLPSQAWHIAYIIIIGILGNMIQRYEWKGRRVQ